MKFVVSSMFFCHDFLILLWFHWILWSSVINPTWRIFESEKVKSLAFMLLFLCIWKERNHLTVLPIIDLHQVYKMNLTFSSHFVRIFTTTKKGLEDALKLDESMILFLCVHHSDGCFWWWKLKVPYISFSSIEDQVISIYKTYISIIHIYFLCINTSMLSYEVLSLPRTELFYMD